VDIFNRAQDAGSIFQAAKENYNDLNTSFSGMKKRLKDAQLLLKQNRLNAIQLAQTRLDVLDADIIRQNALAKLQEAAGNFRFAIGQDVIKNIIPKTLEKLLNEPLDHIATIDGESENFGSLETVKNK
jgi:outer membrane protein TolC